MNSDRRSYIHYPVLLTEIKKLFENRSNNLLHYMKIPIANSTTFPTKQYLISKIQRVLDYSAGMGLLNRIIDHEKKEISVEETVIIRTILMQKITSKAHLAIPRGLNYLICLRIATGHTVVLVGFDEP